jgi:hypothetical protein
MVEQSVLAYFKTRSMERECEFIQLAIRGNIAVLFVVHLLVAWFA